MSAPLHRHWGGIGGATATPRRAAAAPLCVMVPGSSGRLVKPTAAGPRARARPAPTTQAARPAAVSIDLPEDDTCPEDWILRDDVTGALSSDDESAGPSPCCVSPSSSGEDEDPAPSTPALSNPCGGTSGSPDGSRRRRQCGKVMLSHSKRERLSKSWAAARAGASDVARGRAVLTPSARQRAAAGAAWGGLTLADLAATRNSTAAATPGEPGGGGLAATLGRSIAALSNVFGHFSYKYYLWRETVFNDIQVILMVNLGLLAVGSAVYHTLAAGDATTHPLGHPSEIGALGAAAATAAVAAAAGAHGTGGAASASAAAAGAAAATAAMGGDITAHAAAAGPSWWESAYATILMSFGSNFPNQDASPGMQLFSVFVAMFGLAAFALVLALVEQVVLEANNRNVKRGSAVYETGHVLILGWAKSQRDLEMVAKVTAQICQAYRQDGGTTVVVLTQREKLEMEETFRRVIPESARFGSQLVFRQGSPMVPSDLRLVAAGRAGATVIVNDLSLPADEADAQVIRCAILLDELDDYSALRQEGSEKMGHVVAEVRTKSAVSMLRYSCSPRVVAVPTWQLNARRMSKMVKDPFIAWTTTRVWDYKNHYANFVQPFPELAGCTFGEAAFRFPTGIVWGVARPGEGAVKINPTEDYILREGDALVICRPTNVSPGDFHPLPEMLTVRQLEALADPNVGCLGRQLPHCKGRDGGGTGLETGRCSCKGDALCGASAASSASGGTASPGGSRAASPAGGFNGGVTTSGEDSLDFPSLPMRPVLRPTLLDAGGAAAHDDDSPIPHILAGAAGRGGSAVVAAGLAVAEPEPLLAPPAAAPAPANSLPFASGSALPRSSGCGGRQRAYGSIPSAFLEHDDHPVTVLVAGWPGPEMADLIQEMDRGMACLPCGSEVVVACNHARATTLDTALAGLSLHNIQVSHVELDPLKHRELARLDWSRFDAAIILCDQGWMNKPDAALASESLLTASDAWGSRLLQHPEAGAGGAAGAADEPGMLRLDALMLLAQLNIRKCLTDLALPPINIIAQKMATNGQTRFEDRTRLPLGISVNQTVHAANTLAVAAYNPLSLLVYEQLGECADLTFCDSSEYAAPGELCSFWELMQRAQQQGDCLLGWYAVPDRLDRPIDAVVNPQGVNVRGRLRVWNTGSMNRIKLIIVRAKECHIDESMWEMTSL